MRLPIRLLIPLVLLGSAAVTSAQNEIKYTLLDGSSLIADITPSGTRVVGNMRNPDGSLEWGAFYWDFKTSTTPVYIGGGDAVAISDDGSIIAGNIQTPSTPLDNYEAAIYDLNNPGLGWQGLPARSLDAGMLAAMVVLAVWIAGTRVVMEDR